MSSPREGAAGQAPAWKQALLERKRAKLAAGTGLERGPPPGKVPEGREARPVLAESLGPLRENPFMRLEGGGRRRRRGGGACELSPEPPALSQLLELYGAMPGIRTIRADNILIIESRDGAAAPRQDDAPGRAPRGGTPLLGLLSRGGCPVTEIRAAQVVVYEPAAPPSPDSGRVSRLLQKFDQAAKGRGRAGGGGGAPRAQGGGGGGGFMQKIGSNSFVVNPRGCRPGTATLSRGPAEPEAAPPPSPPGRPGQRGPAAIPKAMPSSGSPAASTGKPKSVEASPRPPCSASPDSPPRPSPLFTPGCSFEIRPAPKPDLAAIPAHDLQARALASLRLKSRNSFLFVPCRKEAAPGPPEAMDVLAQVLCEKPAEAPVPVTYIDEDLVPSVPSPLPPLKALSPRLEGFDVLREGTLALQMEESALPTCRPLSAGSVPWSQKGTSTFTVVPKRKPPAAGLETFSRRWLEEEEEEEEDKSQTGAKTGAPQQELAHGKKRYPTVNEIEVIGGYLSLDKSCMSKSGLRSKKLKISFNETSLQTMFEYPSESSLVVEEEEEEEEEYATEVDEEPAFFMPHPNSTVSSYAINSGLSSYTPKHSLDLGKWQAQQHEKQPPSIRSLSQETDLPNQQVMLTPAEKSHLSDFSSEPALYF